MQQQKTGRPKENLRTKYKANIHHDYKQQKLVL